MRVRVNANVDALILVPDGVQLYTRDDLEKALEGARTKTRDEVTEEVITKVVAYLRRRQAEWATFPPSWPTVVEALDEVAGDLQDGEWRREPGGRS